MRERLVTEDDYYHNNDTRYFGVSSMQKYLYMNLIIKEISFILVVKILLLSPSVPFIF